MKNNYLILFHTIGKLYFLIVWKSLSSKNDVKWKNNSRIKTLEGGICLVAFLIVAVKIIILLGFLILIHEAGHLIVAKICKVTVNEFAIGFGPKIWQKQGKETKYTIRLIPLGGFCSMEGEEERSDKKGSFSQASIPKRIAIVIAGATVNILFGLIVYFILIASSGTYVSNVVDTTLEGYTAEQIGLQQGDKIIEINGQKVRSKYDLDKITSNIAEENNQIILKIERNGNVQEYETQLTEKTSKYTGIYIDKECKISAIEKGSPAEKQGLLVNDKILKINNEDINGDVNKITEIIQRQGLGTLLITVERDNQEVNIELTPENVPSYYLGVNLQMAENTFLNHIIYGGIETKEFAFSIIDNLKQLFTGRVGIDQMMGPVGISQVVAETNGIKEFIYLLALISLSLGVTNLLPIPALDGGKILILLVEAIRRKPLKQETEINIQLLGFSILIVLSLFIAYNDILRIVN